MSVDDVRHDVRNWLNGQPPIADLVASAVAIPSLPATLEQNQVLDVVDELVGESATIRRDRWTPDWPAVEAMLAPLDNQALWSPLVERNPLYNETLSQLEVSVHSIERGNGPTLMFNGHVDVVPAIEPNWTTSAFSPHIRDGRLLGRGAMDMKGGLIAAGLAFRYLSERWDGAGTIVFAAVPEEETGGNGTLAALHRGYLPDATVFTEPTDLAVVHRHVGIQGFSVDVAGVGGGILKRSWGLSAAPILARVALALERLERNRTRAAQATGGYDEDDLPGFVNFIMSAGEWPATRAPSGRISGLMSVLPGETQAEAEAELRAAVNAAADGDASRIRVEIWGGGHRGAELDPSSPLVRSFALSSAGPGEPGAPSRAGTMVCDAKIVQGGGWSPSIVLGPIGGGLHAADEWVDLNSINTLVQLLVSGAITYFESEESRDPQ